MNIFTKHHVKIGCIVVAAVIGLSVLVKLILVTSAPKKILQSPTPTPTAVESQMCFTPSCIKIASQILDSINLTIDPCDDFFQFACGNSVNNIEVTKTSQPNVLLKGKKSIFQDIKQTLESTKDDNQFRPLSLAREFYRSCVDTERIEGEGLIEMKTILDGLGGWPVLHGVYWNEEYFDWKETIYHLRKNGYDANYFLDIHFVEEFGNSSQTHLQVRPPAFELEEEMLLKDTEGTLIEKYYNYMLSIVQEFGAIGFLDKEELKEALNFQISLVNISRQHTDENGYNSSIGTSLTLPQLRSLYPAIKLDEYLGRFLDFYELVIPGNEKIFVQCPRYLSGLEDLLNRTPKRVLANYIMWRVVSASIPYLTERLRNLQANFTLSSKASWQNEPRWFQCVEETLLGFSKVLMYSYQKESHHEKFRKVQTEILPELQEQFVQLLQNTTWISESLKKSIGSTSNNKEFDLTSFGKDYEEILEEYYKSLKFKSENYLRVALTVSKFISDNYYQSFRNNTMLIQSLKVVPGKFGAGLPSSIFSNVLNDPFLNSDDLPRYSYYGRTHLLLNIVALNEYYQNIIEDNNTQHSFNMILQDCLKDMDKGNAFQQFPSSLMNRTLTILINSIKTKSLKATYLAYTSWIEEHGAEKQLPGLNYTSQQMFWIFLANSYCPSPSFEKATLLSPFAFVPSDYEPMDSIREDFANDFKCPSKANPYIRCDI